MNSRRVTGGEVLLIFIVYYVASILALTSSSVKDFSNDFPLIGVNIIPVIGVYCFASPLIHIVASYENYVGNSAPFWVAPIHFSIISLISGYVVDAFIGGGVVGSIALVVFAMLSFLLVLAMSLDASSSDGSSLGGGSKAHHNCRTDGHSWSRVYDGRGWRPGPKSGRHKCDYCGATESCTYDVLSDHAGEFPCKKCGV